MIDRTEMKFAMAQAFNREKRRTQERDSQSALDEDPCRVPPPPEGSAGALESEKRRPTEDIQPPPELDTSADAEPKPVGTERPVLKWTSPTPAERKARWAAALKQARRNLGPTATKRKPVIGYDPPAVAKFRWVVGPLFVILTILFIWMSH